MNQNDSVSQAGSNNADPIDGTSFYCNDNLTIANMAFFSIYKAGTIHSDAILSKNIVIFENLEIISLINGFEVPIGKNFNAKIGECQ